MSDRSRNTGLEYANADAIRARIRDLGWSQNELGQQSEVDPGTISRMLKHGEGVSRVNARKIATALDGPVAHYFLQRREPEPDRLFRLPNTEEWSVAEILSEVIAVPNGLRFQVCRMEHRSIPERQGRGKYYYFSGVRAAEKPKREQMLKRHASVSSKIGVHPNIALNLSAVPTIDGLGWWVIDFWVPGHTLDERLVDPTPPPIDLPRLARDMLAGLAALHEHGIVFRELSPSRVILADDGRAVLTDFELAKLTDGAPTVKPAVWKDEMYRAPELDSGRFDGRADLYSWARVLARTVLGELPPPAETSARLARSALPKAVRTIVARCAAIEPVERPATVHDVSAVVGRWS